MNEVTDAGAAPRGVKRKFETDRKEKEVPLMKKHGEPLSDQKWQESLNELLIVDKHKTTTIDRNR